MPSFSLRRFAAANPFATLGQAQQAMEGSSIHTAYVEGGTYNLTGSLNLTSEAAFSWGDIQNKLDPVTGPYSVTNQLVSKVDVGLSRNFDALDVQDRITVEVEFFYNSDGYSQNMLQVPGFFPIPGVSPGYFQTGYYGQYYGAAFITIGDFGSPNMTFSLSGLANFSDQSGTALAGLSYSPVDNFTLSLQLGSNLGADNREYTITHTQFFGILGATVNF